MMEPWMVIALLAAAGIGVAIGFAWGRSQEDAREKQKQAEEELKNYKGQVAEHFGKTAELFDKLTHDYREVYEHLAQSSENLCGDQVPRITADVPQGKLLAEDDKPDIGAAVQVEPVEVEVAEVVADEVKNDIAEQAEPQPDVTAEQEESVAEADKADEADAEPEKKPKKVTSGSTKRARKPSAPKKKSAAARKKSAPAKKKTAEKDYPSSWKSPVMAPPAAEAVDPDIMADDDDAETSDQPVDR